MLERGLKLFVFCLMLLLVLLVGLQVFTRYVLNNPTSWSEEAASFTQVFLVFLGGSLALFKKQTLRITFLIDRLSARTAIIIDLVLRILIILFLLTVIWYSLFAMSRLQSQLTAALRLPKSIIFISVPLGSLLMLIATLRDFREGYSKLRSTKGFKETKKAEGPSL